MRETFSRPSNKTGVIYGLAAYLFWGFVPVYFKAVAGVPAQEVLAHRVLWSVGLLSLLLLVGRRWRLAIRAARQPKVLGTLAGTSLLLAVNWMVFIWAIANGHVLQASLGYFINPLVNVALGFLFLGERLRPIQWLSVGLALAGVASLAVGVGEIPVIALTLALAFGFYGLLRKRAPVDSSVGLSIEMALLLPAALGYLAYLWLGQTGQFGAVDRETDVLLALSGVVTVVPLVWFANAVKRLSYATVGLLQYVAPSLHFMLAVVVYGELFTERHLVAFVCIWTALVVYTADSLLAQRRTLAAQATAAGSCD